MDCKFEIGQNVICINDNWSSGAGWTITPPDLIYPKLNEIYTVRDIVIGELSGKVLLKLVEIPDQSYVARKSGYLISVKALSFEYYHFRALKKIRIEDFLPSRQLEDA